MGEGFARSGNQRSAWLELAVVATRNEQSAREAAEAFGAERWFSDPFTMIKDERIDVITISVKLPAHGLHNARLMDAVRRAGERGERQKVVEQIGFQPPKPHRARAISS